jgi:hypothetical protein
LAAKLGGLGGRCRSPITHQLETCTDHHLPIQVDIDGCPSSPALGELNSLDRSAGLGEIDPVENRCEAQVPAGRRVHGASHRRTGIHEILGAGQPGSFRGSAQLCQVGTPARDRPIQIEFPETQTAAEIEDRYSQTSIRWHQPTPGTQNHPHLAMGGENVECPLKPISTATSDEKVGLTTDPEGRPGSQIYSFVDLRLTVFPDTPEVHFEIGRPVQHEKIHLPEIWHAVC